MIKVGVIGLGNIAQKAYLPVDSQLQDRFEWYLVSRQAEKLQYLQKKYGFQHGTTRVDDLFEENVQAVFIHNRYLHPLRDYQKGFCNTGFTFMWINPFQKIWRR